MALFERLFSSKRTNKSHRKDGHSRKQDYIQKTATPKLDKSKIRLVIFSESERRTPLFDSNAIKPIEDGDKPQNVPNCATKPGKNSKAPKYPGRCDAGSSLQRSTPRFHFHRLGSDVNVLEEMMFGTAAMAFKGSTLKIHLLRSPPQLMISKVFVPEKPCRENICDNESDSSSLPGSTTDLSSGEFSLPVRRSSKERLVKSRPVDVPTGELLSDYSTDDDSGLASFTSSGSFRTQFPSPSNSSLSSYNSLHRRWMRAQTTSLDGIRRPQDSHLSARSMTRSAKKKLAIAIVFEAHDEADVESNEQFQNFFFSHFALIEGHVERLRSIIETAFFNSSTFLPSTMDALTTFRSNMCDLYMAPRLSEPVWLTMMSTTTYKIKLYDKFMDTFTYLVTKFDNKSCKFFVSTLLSAVLTQHLAWVATVTPAGGTPSRTYLDKHTAKWVDTLAKTHPYNPLWAQLGDLFGAIGMPRKISRTVVIGKKAEIVKKFLVMLSYFIRCSEIRENTEARCLMRIVTDAHLDASLSPTSSEKTLTDNSVWDRSSSPSSGHASFNRQLSESNCWNSGYCHKAGNTGDKTRPVTSQLKKSDTCPFKDSCRCDNMTQNLSSPRVCFSNSSDICERGFMTHKLQNGCLESDLKSPDSSKNSCCDVDIYTTDVQKSQDSNFIQNNIQNNIQSPSSHLNENNQVSSMHIAESALTDYGANFSLESEPDLGLSELQNNIPNSLPVTSFTSSNQFQKDPKAQDEQHLENVNGISTDIFARSQSFSEGKSRKSKLSQQLETESTEVKKDIEPSHNESLLSRQSSHESKSHQGRPTLVRHRSTTPTGLSRRRHLSSTGSIDYEAFDPLIHCKEVKLPHSLPECGQWHIRAFDRNFGRSLLAEYTDHYMSDFVLQGTSDSNYRCRLLNDLQSTVKHSILDEPIDEAVCVIADTDTWTVEVASSKVIGMMSPSGCTTWTASQMVADLIEAVLEISKLKMSAEFCLMHMEDRLQEIYFKSLMLAEYLNGATTYNQRELMTMLGFEPSDMPLLFAIAGTHSPGFLLGCS